MLDKVNANAAEQITVSPDQAQYSIQNADALPTSFAQQQSVTQPMITTTAINNQLSDNPEWKNYIGNPFRRSDKKTMPYWAIEDMMADPVYYATTNKYGNELAQQGEIMYGAYRKADSWYGRMADAYNVARYNLRASAARTDLSRALESGDEDAIARAQEAYDREQRNIRTMGLKYDNDNWNSVMDVAASMARNPELLLIGAAVTAGTAGLGAPATAGVLSAGAISAASTAMGAVGAIASAGVVFSDTYRVETGGALQMLDSQYPDMPEEEKYKYASQVGLINAAIEAAPMLIGAGFTARSAASLRRLTAAAVVKSKLPTDVVKSSAFLRAFVNELKKKTVGGIFLDRLIDSSLEGAQEVIQDAVQKAAVRAVEEKDRSIIGLTLEDLNEFMSAENPLDPKYDEKRETFVNIAFASLLLGLPFASIDVISTRRPQNVREKLQGTQTNLSFLNGLRRWAQGAEVAKSSPETITKKLQNEIKLGTIDSQIYLDKQQVLKVMQSDPDVAKALRNLGIEEALKESEENGGVVGIDFLKYEEQVIRGADDTLFQKIRDITSVSPTNLSQAAFIEQLSTDSAAVEEIKRAKEQPNSVYNQMYATLMSMSGWDERSAEAYASMMQLATNRMGAFRLVSSTGEDVFRNVEIRMGYSNGAQIAPVVQTPTAEQPEATPSLSELHNTTQTNLQLFSGTQGFVQTQAFEAAKNNPELVPVGEEGGFAYDAQDFSQAVGDEIDALRSEDSYPRGRPKPFFESNSPIRQAAKKWLTEDPVARTYYEKARQQAADFESALGAERAAGAGETKQATTETTYTGDTIVVDGVERTVYNSNGDRIADTEESLMNFWRWFGDSKVIDEQGRPLVVYHGTGAEFEAFDKEKIGKNAAKLGGGFYTTNVEREAGGYGKIVPLYVSIKNPINTETFSKNISQEDRQKLYDYLKPYCSLSKGFRDNLTGDDDSFLHDLYFDIDYQVRNEKYFEALKSVLGADGVINYVKGTDNTYEFVAFDNTQLKRTDNLGTWSPADERMLHQFVGENANLEKEAPELANRLARAKEMEAEGKSDEEIFNETHAHVGPDGKLRIQISDKDAKLKNIKRRKDGRMQAMSLDKGMTLGDILDHPFLFELYPRLKDIPVRFKGNSSYLSQDPFSGEIKFINFRTSEGEKSFVRSVLHETQHAIQNIESWSRGGQVQGRQASGGLVWERWKLLQEVSTTLKNAGVGGYWNVTTGGRFDFVEPDEFRAMQDSPAVKELEAKDKDFATKVARLRELNEKLERSDSSDARIKYMRLFAEAEARLTEKLAGKSQEELDVLDPYGYFDVSEFIVRNRDGSYLGTRKAPANKQTTGEFTITVSPEATEAVTGKQDEAGWLRVQGDKFIIGITPNANPTTLAHEIFHMFSVSMQQAFNSGEMTDYWKKQVKNLAKMVDAKFETDPVDPTVERLFLTDKQEEKAANMFLQYIQEGKIKNREVAPLFAYMQQAFTRILRALGLRGKLSKESEELFDSLFRAQNDIEEEQKLAGLIAFEKPEGADQELYDFYVGTMLNSRAKAAQDLVRKWYAIENHKKSDKYKQKWNATYADIYKQAQESMVYDIVRTVNDFGGDAAAAIGVITERYPDANITLGFVENVMKSTPTLEDEVTRLTEEAMEQYLKEEFKITDEELALRSSRNRDKVKALLAEGVLRNGGTMAEFEAAYKRANEAVDRELTKVSIKRLLDKDYWNTLEARIVERYAYALANKDNNAIMEERYNQAVVNLIKIRALGYQSRVEKMQAFADKLRTNQKKDEYTAEAWDLLQSIIEKFGFKVIATRRSPAPLGEKLRQWIDNQERATFTTVGPLMNFLPMLQKGFDGTILGMNAKMFDQLDAVLSTIDAIASKEFFFIGENEKILLSSMAQATQEHFENKKIKPFTGKLTSSFFSGLSRWRNPEPILKAIFPESVMQKVWYPLINAKALSSNKEQNWITRYRKARGRVNVSLEKHTYSNGVQLSNADVADLFLSMGTQHAYDNFLKKFGISAEQAEVVVSEALAAQPQLENFVKEVWAIFAESTDLLNDEYQKRNNKLFIKKEPRSFTVNGITFDGGYVPEDKPITTYAMEVQSASKEMGDIKNEKEITKDADGEVKSIIDHMERKIMLFARQSYVPLAYNNAAKFMNNTNIRDIVGERAAEFIDDWMNTGFKLVPDDTTGVVRSVMSATTIAALGGRLLQGMIQLSGMIPAMMHIGARRFLASAMLSISHPKAFLRAVETASSKSEYMKSRYENPVSALFGTSVGEQVSMEGGETKAGRVAKWGVKSAQTLMMGWITYFDAIVSNITWDAAYKKAIDSGMTEEEATLEADSAVRITQTDSMQATRATALKDPLARALTPFSSYIMGMQSQAFALWTGNNKLKAVEFAMGYIVMATFVEALFKEATGGDDDDDKEFVERALNRWYNEVIGTTGSTFIPFANLGGVVGKKIAAGTERGLTGENEVFERYGLSVPMIQYLDRIPTTAYNLVAGITSGDDEYLVKSLTSASGLLGRGFEKQLKEMLDE